MVQLKWYRRTQWTWLLSMSNLKPCCSYYCPGCLDTCVHSEWEEVVVKQPVLKYGAWIRMLWCHDEWCILGRRRLSVQGEDDSCDRTQILMLKYVFYLYICVHFAFLKIPFVLLLKSLHDTFTNNIWNRFRTRSQNENTYTTKTPHAFISTYSTFLLREIQRLHSRRADEIHSKRVDIYDKWPAVPPPSEQPLSPVIDNTFGWIPSNNCCPCIAA